jgi:Flp pilus assembly protein TadB
MSVEQVILTFVALGIALCLGIALMPMTGSLLVFLIAAAGGALFLFKGVRDYRTHSASTRRPPDAPVRP